MIISSCFADDTNKMQTTCSTTNRFMGSLVITDYPNQPVGDDPSYEDDFERIERRSQ